MRIYEELFIVDPNTAEEQMDSVVAQIEGIVKDAGGTIDKVEKWGVRKLAYQVKKRDEGFYILVQFSTTSGAAVKEIERRLRVEEVVIKYLTVRIDEDLKRAEKRRQKREKRAARKPKPPAPPPPAAAPSRPGAAAVAPGAPAKPDAESPAKPDAESPAKPDAESPAKPDAESPVKPDAESPVKPDAESPAKVDAESPAKPDAESPAQVDAESKDDGGDE